MNPLTLDSVFQSLIGVFQGGVPKTLPPITKTLPPDVAGGAGNGAGILSAPPPTGTDANGKPEWKVPGVDSLSGWNLENFKKFWLDFYNIQLKGLGWNIFLVLLLLIAFYVLLTGENPVNRISGTAGTGGSGGGEGE